MKPRTKTYSHRYRPAKSFMDRLKKLDSRLGCRFREDLERFVITWEKFYGPPDEIMVVSKPYFRQPDMRELNILCEGDLHRTDMRERLERTAAYFKEVRERKEKHAADEIRNATKDDRIQLANAFRQVYNTGGKPSAIRRIVPKPRGQTIDELQKCVAQ